MSAAGWLGLDGVDEARWVYVVDRAACVAIAAAHGVRAICADGSLTDAHVAALRAALPETTRLRVVYPPAEAAIARGHVALLRSVFGDADALDMWQHVADPRDDLESLALRCRLGSLPTLLAALPRIDEPSAPAEDGRAHFTPIGELLAEPDAAVAWVVDGVMPAGGISIAGAKPKVGKSTMARNLALAVAAGTPFLGRVTTQGGVLCLFLEEKRDHVKGAFRKLDTAPNLPIHVHIGLPADVEPIAWLRAEVERTRATLVVIDTLARFCRVKDANDYAKMTAETECLLRLCRDTGVHVHLTHHAKKGDAATDAIDELLGSVAIAALPDTVLIYKRRPDGLRTLQTRQRIGDDLPETVVAMDAETGALALGGRFDEHRRAVAEAAIEREVAAAPGGLTQGQIRERVEGDTKVIVEALTTMKHVGRIVVAGGTGKKGSPYLYALPRERGKPVSHQHHQHRQHQDANTRDAGVTGFPVCGLVSEPVALKTVDAALSIFPGARVVPPEGWPPPGAVEARAWLDGEAGDG